MFARKSLNIHFSSLENCKIWNLFFRFSFYLQSVCQRLAVLYCKIIVMLAIFVATLFNLSSIILYFDRISNNFHHFLYNSFLSSLDEQNVSPTFSNRCARYVCPVNEEDFRSLEWEIHVTINRVCLITSLIRRHRVIILQIKKKKKITYQSARSISFRKNF